MKVLIACEFSGAVRDAFIAAGHDAMSCDLLPSEKPGPHYQGDIRDVLYDGWDMMIAHPPCTYLTNAANRWLTDARYPDRHICREEAIAFFRLLLDAPIAMRCIENPVPNGALPRAVGMYSQTVQPYQFGADASKRTCLWLRNLPRLALGRYIEPQIVDGKKRWGNQSPSGADSHGPSPDRWRDRSRTFQGIANAMASQWGELTPVRHDMASLAVSS